MCAAFPQLLVSFLSDLVGNVIFLPLQSCPFGFIRCDYLSFHSLAVYEEVISPSLDQNFDKVIQKKGKKHSCTDKFVALYPAIVYYASKLDLEKRHKSIG
jgi:hypothetical protein